MSRSRLENFIRCPRCFYIDRRLGIDQPSMAPFNLNIAVDTLLKKEFDVHRAAGTAHPMLAHYGLDLIPLAHENMDIWRENFQGIQYLHQPTNLLITGAVDDIWQDGKGTWYVVDYKATSKEEEVNLDSAWQMSYKRQLEIYQWLLRQNGHTVSDTGYFVYCNGRTDLAAFDGKLEFDIKIIPYTGSADWIEKKIVEAHKCLMSDEIPKPTSYCEYCSYRRAVKEMGV